MTHPWLRTAIRFVGAIALTFLVVTLSLGHHEDPHMVENARQIARTFAPNFPELNDARNPPESAFNLHTDRYNFGRYIRPIKDSNTHLLNSFQQVLQDKNFVWSSVTVRHLHVGFALLQFQYTAAAVFNVYDVATGRSWSLYRDLPLVLAPLFGPQFEGDDKGRVSVIAGCVRQADWSGGEASVCYDEATKSILVSVAKTLNPDGNTTGGSVDLSLTYSVDLSKGYFPNSVLPLGPRRAAVVSKFAGRPVTSGAITLVETESRLEIINLPLGSDALASTDYTRGLLRRETTWKWASFSGIGRNPESKAQVPCGIHLSSDTYDFGVNGTGSENSVFTMLPDGTPSFRFLDNKVKFVQEDPTKPPNESPWRIEGDGVRLWFFPHGGNFHGSKKLGVIDADLWHMWGYFGGVVRLPTPYGGKPNPKGEQAITVEKVPGVLEDHYALW